MLPLQEWVARVVGPDQGDPEEVHPVVVPRPVGVHLPVSFGSSSPRRYNLTLSAMAMNVLNHPNFANPNGNLSSPFFGQSLGLQGGFGPEGGGSTYDRKISLQLRLAF